MDRITLTDHEAYHSETMYLREGYGGELYVRTNYDIKSVDYISLFVGTNSKLQVLKRDVDFTFSENEDHIKFIGDNFSTLANGSVLDRAISVSIRYAFFPSYTLLDFPRDVIHHHSGKKATMSEIMPIHAIGRRSHYVLDRENIAGTALLDNSYTDNPNVC